MLCCAFVFVDNLLIYFLQIEQIAATLHVVAITDVEQVIIGLMGLHILIHPHPGIILPMRGRINPLSDRAGSVVLCHLTGRSLERRESIITPFLMSPLKRAHIHSRRRLVKAIGIQMWLHLWGSLQQKTLVIGKGLANIPSLLLLRQLFSSP